MAINTSKLLGILAALLISSQASAGSITNIYEVNDTVNFWGSTSWTHDLSDDGFVNGSAVSGSLAIEFSDDSSRDGFELSTIVVGIIDFLDGALLYVPTSDWTGALGVNSLAILNSSGKLEVTVWSDWGDFYIGNSVLSVVTADATDAVTAVPAPASLMLLGIGLAGLGFTRMRKSKAA